MLFLCVLSVLLGQSPRPMTCRLAFFTVSVTKRMDSTVLLRQNCLSLGAYPACIGRMTECPPQGTPYKYQKSITTHSRFVQDVRYSPSGDLFVSVGSDSKIFLYNGDNGDTVHDFGGGVHSGTIVGLCTSVFEAVKLTMMVIVWGNLES